MKQFKIKQKKKQKGELLSILLGALGASLLGNMLPGQGRNRAGEGIIRVGYRSKRSSIQKKKKKKKNPLYPLTSFEIQMYYRNEAKSNGVSSRDNLPKKNKGSGTCKKVLMSIQILELIGLLCMQ